MSNEKVYFVDCDGQIHNVSEFELEPEFLYTSNSTILIEGEEFVLYSLNGILNLFNNKEVY